MKKISLGTSDFKEIIDNNYYFIDKTLIIKEFLEDSGKIALLPRPRRFGKTFNLSILKYFLEKSDEDRSYLFKNLKIENETEIMKKQGEYPLIYLTFKDDKHSTFEDFLEAFREKISSLYKDFYYVYKNFEFEEDKKYFDNIINKNSAKVELEVALLKLSKYLNKYYNQKVIILIDEYDTPIHESHFKNYYPDMIGFIRNFLSSALKDNINLEKGFITGILRVAKESIFSGLNNLEVYSILGEKYSDKFGFTEEETVELLKYYNLDKQIETFKSWYNGYIFGSTTIYNPWSVLSYINKPDREFMPYWVNTSENSIIKELLADGSEEIKQGLETLYNGGYVESEINEDVVMSELSRAKTNLWSFLLLSGYLKTIEKINKEDKFIYKLAVPNKEIKTMYRNIIEKWFQEGFIDSDFTKMLKALTQGDVKNFSKIFKRYVMISFSYFDTAGRDPEKVYHAFVLGMLVSLSSTHEVLSNRESGIGRYDVSLIPKDNTNPGVIFEFKRYDEEDEETIAEMLDIALAQIEDKKYDTELKARKVEHIIKLAIVFNGKEVHIKQG
ncbi:AAA family ATPase [Romboutsia sp.]|uniref:AAA family ATPase n=1 Tax=Romboutsia sp. TaxID=1965302 RepID=UPI003F3CA192